MNVPPPSRQHSRNVMTGVEMGKKSKGTGGDYEIGYGRPPKSGQIKPGEVRNPWGKTGKRGSEQDLLLKVAGELVPANVNGKATSMSQEEGAYRRLFQEALKGNAAALKLLLEHLSRRRPPLPALQTPEEIAQHEAEAAEREQLSARLVRLLEGKASAKKAGAPRVRPRGLGPVADEGE
jgi:hypothetical protein